MRTFFTPISPARYLSFMKSTPPRSAGTNNAGSWSSPRLESGQRAAARKRLERRRLIGRDGTSLNLVGIYSITNTQTGIRGVPAYLACRPPDFSVAACQRFFFFLAIHVYYYSAAPGLRPDCAPRSATPSRSPPCAIQIRRPVQCSVRPP